MPIQKLSHTIICFSQTPLRIPNEGGGVSGLGKWKLGGKIMWKVEIRG